MGSSGVIEIQVCVGVASDHAEKYLNEQVQPGTTLKLEIYGDAVTPYM